MKKIMKCECGDTMVLTKLEIMPDLFSKGYKCQKCGETEFTEGQMRNSLKKKKREFSKI